MKHYRWLELSVLIVVLLGIFPSVRAAGQGGGVAAPSAPLIPTVGYAVQMDVSPALQDMPALAADGRQQTVDRGRRLPKILQSSSVEAPDPLRQSVSGPAAMPAPLTSFDGLGNINGVHPPDTQGDIGYDPATGKKYYVQWVNLSFAVWDVTGTPTLIYGPVNGNTLWQGFGGPCENTNHGDPITLFDPIANRWLMSQFSVNGPYYQCIAVSQTANPTGAWYRYAFQVSATKMNDYPKFGVWPDGYYMTVNQFTNGTAWGGAGVFVFERSKMLVGDPTASFQYFDLYSVNSNFGGMLPSDLDGPTPPPAGAPNYFMEVDDSTWIGPNDALRLWKFHVDWNNPANTTFGLNGQPNAVLPTAEWTPLCTSTRACIPQPGTTVKLDAIGDRLMYRLAYRNFGTHESLVVNHTVNAGGNLAGVRWYEVRDPGGTPVIYQQGTYAPDAHHRWMGSIAMDRQGNMALGYSVSSSSVYPSVRYTGRLASDPLGTMPQGEASLVVGSGYQTSAYNRWGDYSMLSIDPLDDCTFWYTQEYMATSGYAPWSTRIGSFRFPNCASAEPGTLRGVVRNANTAAPIAGATVAATSADHEPATTTSGTDGSYVLLLDPGVYTLTARAYGYFPYTKIGVEVTSHTTTTLNLSLAPAPSYVVSGTVTDAQTGWPLYARILVKGDPFNPPTPNNVVWTDPTSGAYSLQLAAGITYTFEIEAWVAGYVTRSTSVGQLTANRLYNIALMPDTIACTAPGYRIERAGMLESFDLGALPTGWTVTDGAGSGVVWRFDDPKPRGNLTGGTGPFAMVDSDYGGAKNVDTILRSPALDFSDKTTVILEFKYDFRWYTYGLNEVADVDVSNNGGVTWTNVWRRSSTNDRGPKTARINISTLAAGQSDVRVRFHYYNANYEWWWQVDDVFVGMWSCAPAAGGLMVGEVFDANTGAAIPATLRNDGGYATTAKSTDSPHGGAFYTLFAPAGTHILTATATAYAPSVITTTIVTGTTTSYDFHLPAGMLAVLPKTLSLTVSTEMTAVRLITLTNSGGYGADFALYEVNAPYTPVTVTGPFAGMVRRVSPKYLHTPNATTVREYVPPVVPLLEAGAVIQTWPSGLVAPWGVAYDTGHNLLWLGDTRLGGGADRILAYSSGGVPTGATVSTSPWVGLFAADITYNPITGMLWQVNVGDDNCIYEIDPLQQAATGRMLCPSFGVSERGLAYDPTTDTFYSGSWGDQILYHFDATGRLLDSKDLKLNIAGLAYNPATRHLFVMSNAGIGRDVYVLDVAAGYTVIGGFDIEGLGSFEQAGLALDCAGTLWTVNQVSGEVIAAVSGETSACAWDDIPWLTPAPPSGTVGMNAEQVVALYIDTSGMAVGTYPVHLRIANSTPYGALNVPITLTVAQMYAVRLTPTVTAQGGLPGATVHYTFTVTNEGLETDTFTVALSGNMWNAVAPQAIGPLAAGTSASGNVQVTVPAEALCAAADTLTLTVTSQGNPRRTATATVTTTAMAVYGVQTRADATMLAADPAASVGTALWVTNTGNCADTFALSGVSAWPLAIPTGVGPLLPGSGAGVAITVTLPSEAPAGDYAVAMVTATSQTDAAVSATVMLTTTANAVYHVSLRPDVVSKDGRLGHAAVYTLTLINTGNITDSYALAIDGALWNTVIAPPMVTLASAAAMPVVVTVTVPAGAWPGAFDTARVTAHGSGVSAAVALTTTAVASRGVMVSAPITAGAAMAGQTITYTVWMTNSGDYTDTFTVDLTGHAWPVSVSQSSVELGAQAGTTVHVGVAVPATAAEGDTDTLTLTVTSQADGGVAASVPLTTQALECVTLTGAQFTYMPLHPFVGQTVTFSGTVTQGAVPIVYTWNFADGATAVGEVVTHTFEDAAAYTVVMTATNVCGQVWVQDVVSVQPYRVYLPLVLRTSD